MKITIRRILTAITWVALLIGQRAFADDYGYQEPDSGVSAGAEVVTPGPARPNRAGLHGSETASDNQNQNVPAADSVVGAHEAPANGIFGDTAPAACEFCGGSNCMPSEWSLDASIQLMASSRPNNHFLGATSLPFGPLQVTSGSIAGQPLQYAFINNAINTSVLEFHTLNPTVSPAVDLTVHRFLGRDGENRDHSIELEFAGLERFSDSTNTQGTIVPVYDPTTTNISQTFKGNIILYTGSLISPFTFPHSVATSPFVNPTTPQTYDPTNAYAFNGATQMSVDSWSTFNNFEVNYRIAGNNQQDQMVLNPNGHWYRQCKSGFFYSYLFGFRTMVIDEQTEWLASGTTFNSDMNPTLFSQGRYVARTQNTLLGLQTGGTLEYRFCRWALETHGKAGAYINVANQDSLIQTSLHGYEYNDNNTQIDQNTSTAFNSGHVGVAFAGGFGVGGSYKFTPSVVGHISYDMLFVGDVARAAEQFQFGPTMTPQIDVKGSQFYDGMTFGLEYDW